MATKKSASTKAGARKKVTAKKKTANRKKTAKKKLAAQLASANGKLRYDQIQEKAYYIAEEDGFTGDPTHYWLEAQKQLGVGA